jgi:hypothetical protein
MSGLYWVRSLTDSGLHKKAPYEPFELDHGLPISSSTRLQSETLSYRLPAASSACHIDHIEQSCLPDSLENIPRMTRSGFYLVHLLTLCSGLVGHSQCSTLARNPSNAKMTEGILTEPSLQSLKLSSYEAYDQRTAQAFGAKSLWLATYEFAVLSSQHYHADQHASHCLR